LSSGASPSGVIRRTFPRVVERSCAFADEAASPTTAYSIPSGPKRIRPPLWMWLALARLE
jgi:hypothetical protein